MMSFGKDKMIPMRALMALVIVADHLTFFVDTLWLKPARELGAPIVSIFFFISGFGLFRAYQTKGPVYLDSFIRNKIFRIVLPVVLALLLYYGILWDPNRDYMGEWKRLLFDGRPVLPYSWFAVAFLYFYIIYYLSFRFLSERWRIFGLFAGVIIWMAIVILAGYDWCWWISSLAFPAGAIFAWKENEIYAFCESKRYRYYAVMGGLFFLFLIFYLPRNPYLWTLCHVLIPIIVALIVARLPIDKLNCSIISFLAAISFEIYLCQGIPMELFKYRITVQPEWLYIISVYAMTIALAFLVNRISSFITKRCTSSTT